MLCDCSLVVFIVSQIFWLFRSAVVISAVSLVTRICNENGQNEISDNEKEMYKCIANAKASK